MKSRDTLIRLKRFQVEEKRRRVKQIEAMVAEFTRMAGELDREIANEEKRAGISDPHHFAYPTYAKAAIQRRENLTRSGHRLLALEFAGGLRPRNGNRLWDRLHGYLLRFGQRATDTFCRLKQSRRHHQHLQKHEHQVTRMLHH